MSESVVRLERRRGFTVVQNEMLRDSRLSLKTKGLFAVMLSKPGDWEFSVSGLAHSNGVGRDAIRSSLVELEKAGYLVRERQAHGERGKFAGNVYILHEESCMPSPENPTAAEKVPSPDNPATVDRAPSPGYPAAADPAAADPLPDDPTQVKKDLVNITPYSPPERQSAKEAKRAQSDRLFEAFWAAYPRKVNKARAHTAWDKLCPDRKLCKVMGEALRRFTASPEWQKEGGAYIPHPATWLRNRRWEDEDIWTGGASNPLEGPEPPRWGWD